MVAETDSGGEARTRTSAKGRRRIVPVGLLRPITDAFALVARAGTSSLTRRIVILNLAALVALVGGILYLNKFRSGLIDTRAESLLTQGQIIAAAVAA
jgi:two-component system, OmpR family, sensor histidine kinase ChvG